MEWREKYNERINSEAWRDLKRGIISERGEACERCGTTGTLHLHHKNYERLGCERTDDLELLCPGCHADADEERAKAGRRRSEQARFTAGLDTYATKKYGEDWVERADADEIAEEFGEWLERQDDC
jgi:hypothetical protein